MTHCSHRLRRNLGSLELAFHRDLGDGSGLYVDLTSDGGSFRDANAWRHQLAFKSGCLADVDRFGRGDVAFDRAQHDDRLGEY